MTSILSWACSLNYDSKELSLFGVSFLAIESKSYAFKNEKVSVQINTIQKAGPKVKEPPFFGKFG